MKERKAKVVLTCAVNRFDVCMIMKTDGATMLSEEVSIVLLDKTTGLPCMGATNPCLTLKKKEILQTKDILHQLWEFDLPFSFDDLKEALEKAQDALLNAEKTLKFYDNRSIGDVYKSVMRGAFQHIEETDDRDIPYILKRNNALWIRKEMLERLLDRAGYGKTCTIFAKELIVFGEVMGKDILTRNRFDGYGSLTTINKVEKHFFRINVIPELFRGGQRA